MTGVLWSSVIAVVGTLCGGLLAGLLQARLAGAARRENRCDARRTEALTAVTALVSGLADHRRAMWVREEMRLAGADHRAVAEARAVSHATRSAVTAPLVTVSILTPPLARVARQAADATYALRGAVDQATLAALRDQAIRAADRLIEATGQFFAACASTGEVSA